MDRGQAQRPELLGLPEELLNIDPQIPGLFQEHLNSMPNRADHKPGLMRAILLAAMGGMTGLSTGDPLKAYGLTKSLGEQGYNEALQDWAAKGQGLQSLMENELGVLRERGNLLSDINTRDKMSLDQFQHDEDTILDEGEINRKKQEDDNTARYRQAVIGVSQDRNAVNMRFQDTQEMGQILNFLTSANTESGRNRRHNQLMGVREGNLELREEQLGQLSEYRRAMTDELQVLSPAEMAKQLETNISLAINSRRFKDAIEVTPNRDGSSAVELKPRNDEERLMLQNFLTLTHPRHFNEELVGWLDGVNDIDPT